MGGLFFYLLLFEACDKKDDLFRISGKTMGTQYHITVVNSFSGLKFPPASLHNEIDLLLDQINQQMSTFINNSEVSRFNRYTEKSWFPVSSDLAFVVRSSLDVSKQTSGAFDITLAPLIDLWGFGAKPRIDFPQDKEIDEALASIGYELLEVRLDPAALRKSILKLRIDLSAVAKGFAVDKISDFLSLNGYKNYLIEIGGEIRTQGKNVSGLPWRIGIEHPDKLQEHAKEYLLVSNLSLATSGDYRNYFIKKGIRYSHTLNPRTGKPVTHNLASVTVLHDSAMMADAYATALSVMGEKEGKVFVEGKARKIRVNMITRKKFGFNNWQNIDEIKIPQSSKDCDIDGIKSTGNSKKWGGCIYLD